MRMIGKNGMDLYHPCALEIVVVEKGVLVIISSYCNSVDPRGGISKSMFNQVLSSDKVDI